MALQPLKLPWSEDLKPLQILQLLLLLFIPSLFILKLTRLSKKPNKLLPPSPPKLPFIGNFHQLGTLPHRSFRALSHKYGPLMLMQLGSSPTLIVSSAEILEEIIKSHDVVFSSKPRMAVGEKLFYGWSNIGFAPYGEYWRQVRKFCALELLSVKRVQSFNFVREEEVDIMIEKINHSCQMGNSINIADLLLIVSNNLISRAALGGKSQGEDNNENKVWEITRELVAIFGTFCVRDFFPLFGWIDTLTGLQSKINKTSKRLDAFLDQVIQEHLIGKTGDKQSNQEDFVDLLLQALKDSTFNIPLTHNNIKGILVDMFVAGTDTTAITVEWAMSELIRNPRVMKKAQEEVRRVVGKKSRVEEDDICQMDSLKSIIKETLRLYPPGPLLTPRVCTRDTDVKGYHIPSKTTVFINAWAIQRDPKLWDNPEEFIPERFTNSPLDFKGQDFKYIPFGTGRRSCPGMSFASASSELILANLLYWFNWELPGNAKGKNLDMTEAPGIALYKKHPLYLLPKPYLF
ncbi:cytochrome P450 71A1-like [Telopea speciosissima]|uniref:cytochrome P450 71A1-like n=1 Tax=Telopea speciosissima TaxID=54955 RepID=UPI001CC4487F|nr:cytochrome P450 71A1-like [Telopea speciosissima]